MIVDEDRSEVFELFATDDGKAAREMEQELDREVVKAEIRRKVQEHLGCRRRPEVVREVVEKVAQIAMWERYSNCDALAADWT